VETIRISRGRKGIINTGEKDSPVLFLSRDPRYFLGKLRRGETFGGEESRPDPMLRVFSCLGLISRGDENSSVGSVKRPGEVLIYFGNKRCAPAVRPGVVQAEE